MGKQLCLEGLWRRHQRASVRFWLPSPNLLYKRKTLLLAKSDPHQHHHHHNNNNNCGFLTILPYWRRRKFNNDKNGSFLALPATNKSNTSTKATPAQKATSFSCSVSPEKKSNWIPHEQLWLLQPPQRRYREVKRTINHSLHYSPLFSLTAMG